CVSLTATATTSTYTLSLHDALPIWSVPWLMEVDGYPREIAARHLLIMGLAILGGYFSVGLFATRLARRGIAARHLFAAGFFMHTDRKSTRLNSSHQINSYAVFCLKK